MQHSSIFNIDQEIDDFDISQKLSELSPTYRDRLISHLMEYFENHQKGDQIESEESATAKLGKFENIAAAIRSARVFDTQVSDF